MNPETLTILTNREVIAVNQDKLGKQGTRFSKSGDQEIWTRQLSAGAIAVAFFNRSKDEAKMSVKWADIGVAEKRRVRDLWLHQDVDAKGPEYPAIVPGHGVVMLRVK
jgi:alpha-galactosidase